MKLYRGRNCSWFLVQYLRNMDLIASCSFLSPFSRLHYSLHLISQHFGSKSTLGYKAYSPNEVHLCVQTSLPVKLGITHDSVWMLRPRVSTGLHYFLLAFPFNYSPRDLGFWYLDSLFPPSMSSLMHDIYTYMILICIYLSG